jgi:predicted O-methyltransferase YrrM
MPEHTKQIDWTLGRMAFQLPEALESYVLAHSTGYGTSAAPLADTTAALGDPAVMMLAREQYALFRFLCALLGCRNALDVGTFTGMSALAFAQGMGPDGRVVTIDRTPEWTHIGRRHWRAMDVSDRIEVRLGEASDVLRDLASTHAGLFDIAFLDVDKARIQEYFDAVLTLLAPRGLVLVDNTLWHGWVLDAARADPDTEGMRRFNENVAHDRNLEVVLVPIGDGLSLIRRLG